MRTATATCTVLLAACGGGGGGGATDAAVHDSALAIDVAPDADSAVTGTWIDTYDPSSGAVMKPACAANAAITVDPNTGIAMTYAGVCHGDGTFRIPAPASVTRYWLKAAGNYADTTARTGIDLSGEHLGRSDVTAATGVTLSFALTGLEAWALGDVMMAFAPNIGYFQNIGFATGAPNNGDTMLTATAPWAGYTIDTAKSDALQIIQLGTHQTGGGTAYVTLDRAYDVAAFTMTNNAPASVPSSGNAAMSSPAAGSLALTIDGASFDALAVAANPTGTGRGVAAQAYAAISTGVVPSPPLFSFAEPSASVGTISFGTVGFGDPFPTAWQRYVRVQESVAVPYTFDGANATFDALAQKIVTKAHAEAGTVAATLGPVASATIDGMDIFTSNVISDRPTIRWTAPALGSPTDYQVTLYEVDVVGSVLEFIAVASMTTKDTSAVVPQGTLLSERQYVVRITSRVRTGIDVGLTPFRLGSEPESADLLSALMTTGQ